MPNEADTTRKDAIAEVQIFRQFCNNIKQFSRVEQFEMECQNPFRCSHLIFTSLENDENAVFETISFIFIVPNVSYDLSW